MIPVLAVALGGALGSVCRYAVGRALLSQTFPWATVVVNLLGCLAIGLVVGWGLARGGLGESSRALLVTGFLGGFTTFSAFGLDAVLLGEDGQLTSAIWYLALQVAGGLGAVSLGLWLARSAA